MEGKKRYIAIILFLLICLMVFTFATTGDEELEKGNGSNIQEITDKDTSDKDKEKEETKSEDKEESKESNSSNKPSSDSSTKDESTSNAEDEEEDLDGTGEVDNSAYDKALEAVEELEKLLTDAQAKIARDLVEEVTNSDQFKELMERVEDAEDAIDATELVEKLEQMVKDAAQKADITDAKDFRDDEVTDAVNEIDGENLEDVKEDLLDRIEELSKILDDDTDPTIDGIKDGAYTNLDEVKLTITDENEVEVKVTKDGKEIDYTETFTEEGTYEVTVVDAAFNDVTKTFTIDRTKPQFEGLTSGSHYDIIKLDVKDNSPVKITISKDHGKATDIANSSELTEDGTYRIVATDEAGNSKEIWVAIDSTLPTIEPDVKYTNEKGLKVTIADKFLMTVTINGKKYTRDDFNKGKNNEYFTMDYTLEEDGEYTIVAKDKKGLSVEKTIILDTVAPKFENLASREVDTDYYKVDVTDATPVTLYVSKDHKAFEEINEGYELIEEGTYQLKAVDAAGNVSTTWIHIDKTEPTITVTPDGEYIRVCPTIEVFDRYLSKVTIDGKVYDRTSFTKNTKNENLKLNVTLEDCTEGVHTVEAVDKKGHKVTKTFTVDTKAPTYKFYKEGSSLDKDEIQPIIIDGKLYFDQNVRVVFEEKTSYFTQYIHNDFVNNENKTTIKRWQREATNDGEHTMKVTDALGHATEVTFTVDTKAPTYKFYKEGSSLDKDEIQPIIIDGKLYFDQNVRVVFEEETTYFTQYIHNDFVNNENKTTIKRWQREVTNDGEHTMKVTDALGQATEVTFTVDTKAPTYKFYKEGSSLDKDEIQPKIVDGKLYFNQNVRVVFEEKTSYFTQYIHNDFVNNENKTTIKRWQRDTKNDGEHTMKVTDALGHATEVTFTVDTAIPEITTINIRGGKSYGTGAKTTYYAKKGSIIYLNVFFKEELYKKPVFVLNGTKTIPANGPKYDPKSNTYNYSAAWELTDELEDGLIQVEVKDFSDKAGNTTTYKLEDYKLESQSRVIVDNSIPEITTINIRGGKAVGTGAKTTYYAKVGSKIYLNVYFKEELEITPIFVLNGTKTVPASSKPKYDSKSKTYNYSAVWELTDELEEGLITVEVKDFSDKAGNTTTYKLEEHKLESQSRVIVDNTKPEIIPSYTEKTIEVNSVEEFTEYPTFELADNYKKDIEAKLVSGKVDPTNVGTYELVYRATDYAGNYSEVTVTVNVVDTTAPVVEASYTTKKVKEDSADEFTDFPIFKVTDNSKKEVKEELISGSVNIHKVGIYKLVYRFTDESGNYTEKTIVITVVDETAPTVDGLVDGAYYNTKDTHAIPVASDKNGAILMAKTKLGDVELKALIQNEKELKLVGTYTIYAVDTFGNKSEEYTVHIDPYDPKILVLDRIENISGAYLPIKPVILEHNIDKIEVTLNGKPIDYKAGDQLTEDGEYVMVVTDKAGNSTSVEFTMDSVAPTMLVSPTSLGVVDSLDLNDVNNVTGLILSEDAEFQLLKAGKNVTVLDKTIPIYEYTKLPEDGIINEEGDYILIAYDKAYNVTAVKFVVDRTAPAINAEDGKFYSSLTLDVKDKNLSTITVKKQGSLLPTVVENGYVIEKDGTYEITAKDIVGVNPLFGKDVQDDHTTTITIHIDTKAPTSNVVEGGIYKKVTVSVSDTNLDEESITINGSKYNGDEITEEGNYVLVAKDLAGNTLTVNFEIDKTPITISGVTQNGLYNNDVELEVTARDEEPVIKLNGSEISKKFTINADGEYKVKVTDKWGNEEEVTFTIDKTPSKINNPFPAIENEIGARKDSSVEVKALVTDNIDADKYVNPVVKHDIKGDMGELSSIPTTKDYVGRYTLTYNTTDKAGNAAEELVVYVDVIINDYVVSFVDVDGENFTYTYGDTIPAFEVQIYSGVLEEYVTFDASDITIEEVDGKTIKNVGTYTVKASANTAKFPNAAAAEQVVTIVKKDVEVTLDKNYDKLSSIDKYEFNGVTDPFKVVGIDGVIAGDEVNAEITYAGCTFDVGDCIATVKLDNNNYNLTNPTHEFTITQAEAKVTLPSSADGAVVVENSEGFNIIDFVEVKKTTGTSNGTVKITAKLGSWLNYNKETKFATDYTIIDVVSKNSNNVIVAYDTTAGTTGLEDVTTTLNGLNSLIPSWAKDIASIEETVTDNLNADIKKIEVKGTSKVFVTSIKEVK